MSRSIFSAVLVALHALSASAQVNVDTTAFSAQLASGSGVLQSLRPKSASTFDFSPTDYFPFRNGNGNYHTGDLTLRFRQDASANWTSADTAANRNIALTTSDQDGRYSTVLNPALPQVGSTLNVTRTWSQLDGDLALEFTISNNAQGSVEIGSLGFPIEFNNIFTNRTAVDTSNKCVLVDPFIGLHAGYLQVTRLTGTGPELVVTPLGDETKFEGWRFLTEPRNAQLPYRQQTYEGNYAWDVFTKAFAEQEWKDAQPWNPPTSRTLEVGQSMTVGLRFSVAPSVQEIENTVADAGVPVAVGIPGYVLPADLEGRLFINSKQAIQSVVSDPEGNINVRADADVNGWKAFTLTAGANAFGRSRLVVTYDGGKQQVVQYHLAKDAATTLEGMSNFLTTKQWFTDSSDPFNRSPSVLSYDHEVGNFVLQDQRAWIAGISDEGGAGSFLAAGMKQAFSPDPAEVAKMEAFVNETVWGDLQFLSGNKTYGVKKSLFFYEPAALPDYQYSTSINWNTWSAWNRAAAFATDRAYDYVHVSNLYWSLYRAGKSNPDLLTQQTPEWYLRQAHETVMFVYGNNQVGYGDVGLMGETIWGYILNSLREEGLTAEADEFEGAMRERQTLWSTQANPFGSEMAWDSTGQEGVYYWSKYFNDQATADKTLASIRGFMPTIPHWGYNGNARRYWDFIYAGKYMGIERQIHHYGSGLNSLPLLENYRLSSDPSSLENIYDLRVGYGGNQGPLSNIQEDGFGSMAFHSFPEDLFWDPYSGDYGPNFVGHALGAATYLVQHPTFGWVSFGGNVVSQSGDEVTVEPKDTLRKRVYVSPLGAYLTIDAGTVTSFSYNAQAKTLSMTVNAREAPEGAQAPLPPRATLTVEQGSVGGKVVVTEPSLEETNGRYVIDFAGGVEQVVKLGVQ
ncbi:ATP-dependent Clp protease ATP-binding subunit ClpX [Elsinoe australis]|uniref:ATP-dependent Clp protease ATP-binding subunit ClpX n=1 Tax=Elsinoe australis TaxID=40998 RepID=A0A2P7YBX8_9PEZI|nr:ATP-dependent Clp protease ATP-binding subunit ClpX [Elsinoe australis]